MHIARIGAHIVVHPHSRIAGAAVAVENDADGLLMILVLCEQLLVDHVRGDLIAVPDILVDVAVQIDYSQDFTSLDST